MGRKGWENALLSGIFAGLSLNSFHFLSLTFSGCRGIIGRNFYNFEIRLCISGKEAAHEPHHDPYRIPPGAG